MKKHIIIGTAGHIDHGKTTLIKALTGRDTDRLKEEKKRGITIDLGFTYFDLPGGNRAGIVDVPGHEKFVNNMVAGVVGMDLVLLVIAADEGIMPQTREHMDILHLLGVNRCIVVLTKCDLVDADWLEFMEAEVREELSGTFLENAPLVKVSSATGEGIDALVEMIEEMAKDAAGEGDESADPYLPVDRVFTIAGFGTVVTGTLVHGTIRKEDALCLFPVGREVRIRGIQVHGESENTAFAGQRSALNLSNVKKEEVKRGYVLAKKDSMKNTDLLDVRLNVLPDTSRVLKNHERLHLFTGTSQILCRAILLDREELPPGESGYVQLRLEEETAVHRGDRFVVRFYSPEETIGGGVILDPNPGPKRRFKAEVIEELKKKESGSASDLIELEIRSAGEDMLSISELKNRLSLTEEKVSEEIDALEEEGCICVFTYRGERLAWHADAEKETQGDVTLALQAYEEAHPYRHGMKKAEVRGTFFKGTGASLFDKITERWEEKGILARHGEYVSTPDFKIVKDAQYEKIAGGILTKLNEAGYDFLRYEELNIFETPAEILDDILNLLIEEDEVVNVAEDLYTLRTYMDEAAELIREKLKEDPVITIAQVRDLFQTSRKSAKPILEYMDAVKVTKKTGGESERVAY